MNNILLGERIKEERLKQKLTRKQLAEKVGVSRQYISFIETGRRNLSVPTLVKFADCLDLSIDYLIKGKLHGMHKKSTNDFEQVIQKYNLEKEFSDLMDVIKAIVIKINK